MAAEGNLPPAAPSGGGPVPQLDWPAPASDPAPGPADARPPTATTPANAAPANAALASPRPVAPTPAAGRPAPLHSRTATPRDAPATGAKGSLSPATTGGPGGAPRPTLVVRPGDCLWDLAAKALGPSATPGRTAAAWPAWWAANRSVIGDDPNLLQPGTTLVPPR